MDSPCYTSNFVEIASKGTKLQRISPQALQPLFDAYPDLARRFFWTTCCRLSNRLLLIDVWFLANQVLKLIRI